MAITIGVAVVVPAVIVLLLWTSHRTFTPDGAGSPLKGQARRTRVQAREKSARWGAGM